MRTTVPAGKGARIFVKDERTGQSDTFHYEDGLSEFVKYLNRTETVLMPDVIRIRGEATTFRQEAGPGGLPCAPRTSSANSSKMRCVRGV